MMTQGKYVAGTINGLDTAVVFHKSVEHSHMARVLDGGAATSAGFFCLSKGNDGDLAITAEGESVSLGLTSDPRDANLIAKAMGLYPYTITTTNHTRGGQEEVDFFASFHRTQSISR